MFKRLLRSQTGFSIIQGMMLAAAVAGMAYVGTKLTTDQKLAQKGAESKGRVEQLHSMIYSIMQNKVHCTETFKQNGITPIANECYAGTPSPLGSHGACFDLGGSPGATHPPGDGPCADGTQPPDTICIKHTGDALPSGPCDWTTMCHGLGDQTLGTTNPMTSIWTASNTSPVFRINANAGTSNYDPALLYMNNSVSINNMNVIISGDPAQHADFELVYGKIDSKDLGSRTGKGFGGKATRKVIKLKIQRDVKTNLFESCYAVDEVENQNMVKDFCEGLGADNNPATPNLFEWDATHQKCVLKDTQCPSGQIFTGFDSNGQRLCYAIQNWMNFNDLIDSTATNCNLTTNSVVRFGIVGKKVQIQCGETCTNSCDCAGGSGMNCESGVCVDRGAMGTGCVNGTYGKGDASCRFICDGGMWSCGMSPPGPPICGAPSCKPTCPSTPASAICTGYSIGGDNDGCGGTCPMVKGTNPNTCASGLCLCTPPGSLANGTKCEFAGDGHSPPCFDCINPYTVSSQRCCPSGHNYIYLCY
jgi:hypothetical protein